MISSNDVIASESSTELILNDITFSMPSQAAQILHKSFFETEHRRIFYIFD